MQNKTYIDNLFSEDHKESEIRKAHIDIVAIQKNEKPLLKSGFNYIDDFLPDGLTNKMVFGGSRPAMGKTFNCGQLIDNLLNKDINAEQEIEILRFNWEMISSSLLLRELKKNLKKSMKDIIKTPYTDEEKPVVTEVVRKLDDPRIVNVSRIVEYDDLKYLLRKFCETNPTKKKVVIVDHLHILSDKKRIDDFLSICNDFKLEFATFTLIGYFQLNRTLETMWRGNADSKPNPKNFRPHSGHIYNTDALQQFADLIYTLIIPQVANMDEYASVSKEYYSHLEPHFVEGAADSTWARLKGRNRLYVDVIKVRLVDDFEDPRFFCFLLDPTREDKEVKPFEPKVSTDNSAMPKFDIEKEAPIEPATLEQAFGPTGEDDEDRPF